MFWTWSEFPIIKSDLIFTTVIFICSSIWFYMALWRILHVTGKSDILIYLLISFLCQRCIRATSHSSGIFFVSELLFISYLIFLINVLLLSLLQKPYLSILYSSSNQLWWQFPATIWIVPQCLSCPLLSTSLYHLHKSICFLASCICLLVAQYGADCC